MRCALISGVVLAWLLLVWIGHAQPPFEETLTLEDKAITLEADFIGYALDDNIIMATGNVKINIGRIWIQADSLQISIEKRLLQAQGNVVVGKVLEEQEEELELEQEGVLEKKEKEVELLFRGDAVVFDLRHAQGSVYRVSQEVEVIYFHSEDLLPLTKPMPSLAEQIDLPDLQQQKIAMVAKRMRFRLGSRMEAWKVTFYHKGVTIIRLPYYTTAAVEFVRDIPFHLRDVSFSSTRKLKATLQYTYRNNKASPGFLDLFYQQKPLGGERIRANFQQRFNFWEKTSLRLTIQDAFSKKRSTSLGIQHYLPSDQEVQVFFSHGPLNPFNSQMVYRRRLTKSTFTFNADWSKLQGGAIKQLLSYQYSVFPGPANRITPRFLLSGSWGQDADKRTVYDQELSLSLIQAPFHLQRRVLMDNRVRFQGSISKRGGIGQSQISLNGDANVIMKFSPSTDFFLGYRYSTSKTEEENAPLVSVQRQSLFGRLSISRPRKFDILVQGSYDLTRASLVSISPSANIRLRDRLSLRLSTSFDPQSDPNIRTINAGFQYSFLGEADNQFIQAIFSFDRALNRIDYSIGIPFLQ